MDKYTETYINSLECILKENGQKEKAAQMSSYMRNMFPFFGISSPERKEIFRQFIKDKGTPAIEEITGIVKALYDRPEREFHYFAMVLADRLSKKMDRNGFKLFDYMVVNKSWWDTVDFIAANSIGSYFRVHSDLILPVTTKWMDSGNIWLQRSCILFQLKYKRATDLELLYSFIGRLNGSDEFFIQKAIGWFLREYSKTDPDEVQRYVSSHCLKPLSRREALRVMLKKGIS